MGIFRQKIKVMNAFDLAAARAGSVREEQVRQMEVSFLIDSGAFMMCINENIQQQLDLPVVGEHEAILADGSTKKLQMVTGLEVRVFNRRTLTDAIVLPGNAEPLFGSIPMEALDVIVDPRAGELKLPPDRPYIPQTILK